MANTDRALICHIIYRLAIGGLENGLVNLVNHLPADNYRHAIICLTEATEFRTRIRRDGVEIYELGKRPGKDALAYVRLWQLLRRLRPRIVHTRNLPALDSLFIAWLAGVPRLVHGEHGLDVVELDGHNRKYNFLRRLSRSIVDHYVAVSRNLYDWLRDNIHIDPAKIELIYNGVDTERFSPLATDRSVLPQGFNRPGLLILGTIGRLEDVKNPQLLASAFCLLLERRPDLRESLRLVFIGNGSLKGQIEEILLGYKVRDLAWLPGFRDDTPSLYRAFDIFVLPSLREGISNTALEAMASGLPIIATDVGGNPEIIPQGVVGQLVPSNDPQSLADSVINYCDAPTLLRRHGDAARAHVEATFSLLRMAEKYDKLYRGLL